MGKLVNLPEFGHEERDVYLMVSQISHFVHCASINVGTIIYLNNGSEIVVGANLETVRDAIEQAGKE